MHTLFTIHEEFKVLINFRNIQFAIVICLLLIINKNNFFQIVRIIIHNDIHAHQFLAIVNS